MTPPAPAAPNPVFELRLLRGDGWGGRFVLAIGVYAALALLAASLELGSPATRAAFANAASVLYGAVIIVLSWRNARDAALAAGVRRAWFWIGLGYLCVWIADSSWAVRRDLLGEDDRGAVTDVIYLFSYPFLLLAVVSFPLALRSLEDRVRLWLDLLVIAVGGAMAQWFFVLRPTVLQRADDPLGLVLGVGYALGDLIVIVAVTTIWLRRHAAGGGRVVATLACGLGINFLTDLVYSYHSLRDGYENGGILDALWAASAFVVALSALQQRGEKGLETQATATIGRPSVLGYVALGLGYGPLLYVAVVDGSQPLLGLVAGAGLLTLLVVLRQLFAVRENMSLLAQASARRGEARFQALVQNSFDVIAILDREGRITFVSPAVSRVFGYAPEALVGRRLEELLHPHDLERAERLFHENLQTERGVGSGDWRVRHGDGRWRFTENVFTNLLAEPTVGGVVLTMRDASERRVLEERLFQQAFHDTLTELPNRALFMDRLTHALARRSPQAGGSVAVLFLDLDDFKLVNDTLGHAEGDRLLGMAAERLGSCVRAGDTVARLGGDEFAVLIEAAEAEAAARDAAQRIGAALARPFELTKEVRLTVSVGIAVAREGETLHDLLRNADVAMYFAKSRGKGRSAVFEPEMHTVVRERLEAETRLREAIAAGALVLHFQPVVRLADSELMGFEALLRWQHPRDGLRAPGSFLPLAEDTGLIVPIGRWLIREACFQWRAWGSPRGASGPLTLSVNLSARHFQVPTLVEEVAAALNESGIDARCLVLEITENVLTQTETTLRTLHELKALGVSLAIDDFGTGYSSLSYLQRLPISTLKIDKAFVDEVGTGREAPLVRAVLGLATALGLDAIAEGIESADQVRGLLALGCPLGQGYVLGRPMPAVEVEALLRRRTPSRPGA